jgi:type IV secretion system protein VirB6
MFMASAGLISAATLAIGVLTAVGPIFIALFLIPATRGLFVGWVRALAAAAFVTLLGWLIIVLMLSVLEPWLVALAQQRRDNLLDPQTALSAAAMVFVFAAGQAALAVGACVMALGFRLRSSERAEPRTSPTAETTRTTAAPEPSRATRLAFDLQRDQALASQRLHPMRLAAPNGTGAAEPRYIAPAFNRPARLGEAYRRPAVAPRHAGSRT